MTRRRSVLVLPVLALLAAPPASAELAIPDCDAMAAWAKGADLRDRWQPNPAGGGVFPAILMAPETSAMLGKGALDWTHEEATALANAMIACERSLGRARRDEARAIGQLRANGVIGGVRRYLSAREQAKETAATAVTALEAAPATLQLLAYVVALEGATTSVPRFNAANQRAGQVSGPAQAPARALLAALRSLPSADAEVAVAPLAARVAAMRAAVQQEIMERIAAVPPSLAGLEALHRLAATAPRDYGAALGAERVQSLGTAIAARRAALGTELADGLIARLGRSPVVPNAFAQIDAIADERALRAIAPEDAARVREAAASRRGQVGRELMARFQQQLASLPIEEASLDMIDAQVLPEIARWPDSAASQRARFAQAAAERRREVLDRLNRAEAGPLEGRVYGNQALTVEFVDGARVFVKDRAGQTTAGTYAEEADGRVIVTVNGQANVFTREGRRLVNGPMRLVRAR
ncbi:hypothetical protein [Elioraea sp.]|jgi:hypothetical protein|uniref:hypothetical protein n=1 Tax=Elioraea sp. TaxID=2185103 RepID=UPI00307F0E79